MEAQRSEKVKKHCSLIVHIFLSKFTPGWAPPITNVFLYLGISLQYIIWAYQKNEVSGTMLQVCEKTYKCTVLHLWGNTWWWAVLHKRGKTEDSLCFTSVGKLKAAKCFTWERRLNAALCFTSEKRLEDAYASRLWDDLIMHFASASWEGLAMHCASPLLEWFKCTVLQLSGYTGTCTIIPPLEYFFFPVELLLVLG